MGRRMQWLGRQEAWRDDLLMSRAGREGKPRGRQSGRLSSRNSSLEHEHHEDNDDGGKSSVDDHQNDHPAMSSFHQRSTSCF